MKPENLQQSNNMKNIFVREKKFSKNKSYCVQFYFSKIYIGKIITFDFDLFDFPGDFWYHIQLGLFGDIFNFNTNWNRKSDHAGWDFDLTIFGLCLHLNIHDIRHWDYDNECWETYDN